MIYCYRIYKNPESSSPSLRTVTAVKFCVIVYLDISTERHVMAVLSRFTLSAYTWNMELGRIERIIDNEMKMVLATRDKL